MKTSYFFKRSLHNQEIFETGCYKTIKRLPQLKKVTVFTKSKILCGEERLLLKLSLLKFALYKKAYIFKGSKKNDILKNIPISGFVKLRCPFFFVDFFLSTSSVTNKNFLFNYNLFSFWFNFDKKPYSVKHFFRYSFCC